MHKAAVPNVHADMGVLFARGVEEHQITDLDVAQLHRHTQLGHIGRLVGQIGQPQALPDLLDQPAAIQAGILRAAAQAVAGSHKVIGNAPETLVPGQGWQRGLRATFCLHSRSIQADAGKLLRPGTSGRQNDAQYKPAGSREKRPMGLLHQTAQSRALAEGTVFTAQSTKALRLASLASTRKN